ncbi:MAG: low molecular weight protein arginine phosphatase [Alphaproteobacteria bacterium]|nr:low molecular weight protein arginine phosphatase [Alphaproteobacteria bacterium]
MKLLFVCTGNICRSPMAAVLAHHLGQARGLPIETRSAGTLDLGPRPAERHAQAVVAELGLALDAHLAHQVTPEDLAWADHVLCMELEHAVRLRAMDPALAHKVELLGPYAGVPELPDPMGGWRRTFRTCRDQLARALGAYLDRVDALDA